MRARLAVPVLVLILILVLVLAPVPAGARGIYKCSDASAVPVYQDRPCGAGQSDAGELPVTLSVVPFAAPAERVEAKPARSSRSPAAARRTQNRRAGAERSDREVIERRHLKEGMSDAEVVARLGPPDFQAGKGGRKMRWTYLPAPGDAQTVTLVKFEDGKVAGVERSILR